VLANIISFVGPPADTLVRSSESVAGVMVFRPDGTSAQVPQLVAQTRQESILLSSTVCRLSDTDFTFCCTDSHGSRAVLNQFAYQYLLPVIDMGVVIRADDGAITDVVGRVQMLTPPLACLVCGSLLDAEQVRRDMLTDFERQADPWRLREFWRCQC